jgi:hypothetical protein
MEGRRPTRRGERRAEAFLAPITGVPGLAASAGIVLEHVITRRRRAGEEFTETVVSHVGEDELLTALQTDDECNELLWSSVQAYTWPASS